VPQRRYSRKMMNVSGIKKRILSRTFWLYVSIMIGVQAAGYPIWVTAKPYAAVKAVKNKPTAGKRSAAERTRPLVNPDPAPDQVIRISDLKPGKAPAINAIPDAKSPYAYQADLGGAVARFQDKAGRRAGVRFNSANAGLGFFLRDSTGSTAVKIDSDHVDFIKGDTKVRYTVAGGKIKEEIVLKAKPPGPTLAFDYYEDGVRREATKDGGWRYLDENEAEVFRILPATVKDAGGAVGTASMAIQDATLTLTVDPAFLQRAAYPVVIDPTVVTTTTVASATRYTNSRKLVRTKSGALFLLYQRGSGLAFRVSTDMGNTWGAPTSISTTTRYEASIVIDGNDNIYAAYADNTATNTVAFRKLAYAGNDTWTVGAETIVTTETAPRQPSINRDTGGRIWVSYRYNSVNIYTRYSDNDGAAWSASTVLGSSHNTGSALLVPYNGYPAAIFEPNATSLAWKYWNGASWSATQTIMSGTNIDNYNFSAVVTKNNYIHVVYGDGSGGLLFIRYTYFNGVGWSSPVDITANVGDQRPQLTTNGRDIWVFWSQYVGRNQYKIVYKKNNGVVWDPAPTVFTPSSERQFEQVRTRNAGVWTDETVDASNTVTNDVPFFNNNGDTLYAGQSEKFNYVFFDLTVSASANTVPTWQYWNGAAWSPLTITENPTYGFTADGNIRFTAPADWTTTTVNGGSAAYFVRATRTAAVVATRPVAAQFSAIKYNTYPMTIMKDLEIAGVAWSEGQNPNYNVLFQPFAVSTLSLTINSTFNRDGTSGSNSNDFGSAAPFDSPFVIHPDVAKHAIQLTVGSDVFWDLLVQSDGDFNAGGGKTMPIDQLSWRLHSTADPWTSFSTSPTVMLADQTPTAGSAFRYDFKLVTTWNDDPGTYLTTVTYTALPAP